MSTGARGELGAGAETGGGGGGGADGVAKPQAAAQT
jgi:hypothetical protein